VQAHCRLNKLLGLGAKEPYFVGFFCTRASSLAPQKIATQCSVAIVTPPNKSLVQKTHKIRLFSRFQNPHKIRLCSISEICSRALFCGFENPHKIRLFSTGSFTIADAGWQWGEGPAYCAALLEKSLILWDSFTIANLPWMGMKWRPCVLHGAFGKEPYFAGFFRTGACSCGVLLQLPHYIGWVAMMWRPVILRGSFGKEPYFVYGLFCKTASLCGVIVCCFWTQNPYVVGFFCKEVLFCGALLRNRHRQLGSLFIVDSPHTLQHTATHCKTLTATRHVNFVGLFCTIHKSI